jgi:glyoxylase I family protein
MIHHVSLEVANLKKSRKFYEEILGLEVSSKRPDFDFGGMWYRIGNTQLHLIVNKSKASSDINFSSRNQHFAIRVNDIGRLLNTFEENDVSYINNPTSKTGWHQVYVQDPDGNTIEFHQV